VQPLLVSPMYIAEVSPPRGADGWHAEQLAVVFGMLLIYFVNYKIASLGSENGTCSVDGDGCSLGAAPALLLFIMLISSLRLLVPAVKGREHEARSVMNANRKCFGRDSALRK